MVLPYIDMDPPWVYMCSPSWTPLPTPSPSHPSGSSPYTSPEHPVSCIEPGLESCFLKKMKTLLLFTPKVAYGATDANEATRMSLGYKMTESKITSWWQARTQTLKTGSFFPCPPATGRLKGSDWQPRPLTVCVRFWTKISGWLKSNRHFALLTYAVWYWNTFLNKCGYSILSFECTFLALWVFFWLMVSCLFYIYLFYFLIFILDYRNNGRQKAKSSNS